MADVWRHVAGVIAAYCDAAASVAGIVVGVAVVAVGWSYFVGYLHAAAAFCAAVVVVTAHDDDDNEPDTYAP